MYNYSPNGRSLQILNCRSRLARRTVDASPAAQLQAATKDK